MLFLTPSRPLAPRVGFTLALRCLHRIPWGFLVTAAPKPGLILHGVRCSISLSHGNKTGVLSFSQSFPTFPPFYFWVDFPEGIKLCNPFLPVAIARRRDEAEELE